MVPTPHSAEPVVLLNQANFEAKITETVKAVGATKTCTNKDDIKIVERLGHRVAICGAAAASTVRAVHDSCRSGS
jgi:myosin-crossreactive antigen